MGTRICKRQVDYSQWVNLSEVPVQKCPASWKDCPHSTAERDRRVGERWQWRAHCLLLGPGVGMEERGDKIPAFVHFAPAEGGREAEPCPGELWAPCGTQRCEGKLLFLWTFGRTRNPALFMALLGTRAKPHCSTAGQEFLETSEHRKGPWSEKGDGLGVALQDHSLSHFSCWQI